MAKKPDGSKKLAEPRRPAGAKLPASARKVAALPGQALQQVVHKSQVQQLVLELQNEELRRVQAELEAARDRYVGLYDFSPAGHLTLDSQGLIEEANLRAGALLGLDRDQLVLQPLAPFIAAEDEDLFQRHCRAVVQTGLRQSCEVRLREGAGGVRWVHLESLAVHEQPGRITRWRTALLDISDRKLAELELETQRGQLEAIIGSAMDAIITVDEQERVVLFNRAAELMFLCPAADVLGQSLDRFIPERFRAAHHRGMASFAKTAPSPSSIERLRELRGLRANGEEFPSEASISHVRVEGKQLFTVVLRDITESKVAEEALQARDAFTRTVLNSLPAQVCVLDTGGVILKTNDAWTELVRQRVEGAFTLGAVGDNYLELCRQAIAGGASTGQGILNGVASVLVGHHVGFSTEYSAPLPEEEGWYMVRVTPLKGAQGVVISHMDISERVRMARALEQHLLLLGEQRRELESLTGKLIQAQEQERKRIARELHDDFNQRLAALSVELETLERSPIVTAEPVGRQLAAIREQVGRLSDDLHNMAYRLHPSLLEHVGLEVAMRDHIAEFRKRTRLPVTFLARAVPETIAPDVATNLFRVTQESLQNAAKHAQATEITVRLVGSPKGIGVSVCDNGRGFDLESKQARVKGLGLVSMQERARVLNGFLRIYSVPQGGTKVCVWIPLSQEGA
ncbi:MAG: PAS domain S-box protein [Nitrospirae bacterium]|nr:PAS domain S-box protein [Nitrospirota bacterium]